MKKVIQNINKPAPRLYRKFENALLILIIPAVVMVLTNWGFKDEVLLNRLLLIVNVLLVAIIKGIGMIIANGEVYAKEKKQIKMSKQ